MKSTACAGDHYEVVFVKGEDNSLLCDTCKPCGDAFSLQISREAGGEGKSLQNRHQADASPAELNTQPFFSGRGVALFLF